MTTNPHESHSTTGPGSVALTIEIPGLPSKYLSPNRFYKIGIQTGAKRAAHKLILGLCREQQPIGEPMEGATVTVTFIVPDRIKRDKGNLIAGAKAYVDGLVKAQIIKDDNWRNIEEVYPAIQYVKGVRKTIIHVEPRTL